jgi:NADP-dependent 3-hydroxy acid dehydrogenase YdfG
LTNIGSPILTVTAYQQTKKVLIAGANGFIGRALCKKMLDEGWQVRGVTPKADLGKMKLFCYHFTTIVEK